MRDEIINPIHWWLKAAGDDLHVVPDVGPAHILTKDCWCDPEKEQEDNCDDIYIHRIPQ